MKCVKCGAELEDGDMFCGSCGAKVEVTKQKEEQEYELLKLPLEELEKLEAKDHDPKVQFALFYYYWAVDFDRDNGYIWASKCAEQNHPDGITALGFCHVFGAGGCEQSVEKAHELIEKGLAMGSTYAIFMVGDCSENGIVGYKKDPEKQFENMLLAAEKGYPEAMENVAKLFEEKDDPQNAIKWFKKAAEFNMADSILQLGIYYYLGNDIEKDYDKSFELFTKAYELDEYLDNINYWLGISYRFGEGVEKNPLKAIEHFEEDGSKYAFDDLGQMYYYGEGVEKDMEKAREYLTKAANAGVDSAKELLAKI